MTSAIAELRSATARSHQRLEKRLDVKARFTELNAYRSHLKRMWGFCAPLERSLSPQAFGDALPDYESRRKAALLERDLRALGTDPSPVSKLAQCAAVPRPDDPAAAFGCLYVIEGATLGGRTLLPLVQKHLGLSEHRGAAYLASYGDMVAKKWRDFGVALDGWCVSPERISGAAHAAVATFEVLGDWLCGEAE